MKEEEQQLENNEQEVVPQFAQVEVKLLQAIIEYLKTRPYEQVAHLLQPFFQNTANQDSKEEV